jgi:HPt (histidine-containing phosphotransfer) domain-containing protein
LETFHQILDLDEDDTYEFSRGMAWAYFTQANSTFYEMDEALCVITIHLEFLIFGTRVRSYCNFGRTKKDLQRLSSLGHFLKGSSAALGVSKVQASCEKIQHYGQLRDEDIGADLTQEEALGKIERLLKDVKGEYKVAEKWLREWYANEGIREKKGS